MIFYAFTDHTTIVRQRHAFTDRAEAIAAAEKLASEPLAGPVEVWRLVFTPTRENIIALYTDTYQGDPRDYLIYTARGKA